MIDAVGDAVAAVGLPIEIALIGIVVRDEGPDSAVAQVRRLLRHQSALVGPDLAGDEAGYPAPLFAPAFRLARDDGLAVTIHAGEAAGPQSVWDALSLAPRRIGHGVRSAEDPELMAAGVRVALCTDNPAVSDTRLTREYELALDLLDAASLDVIRRSALAARFT